MIPETVPATWSPGRLWLSALLPLALALLLIPSNRPWSDLLMWGGAAVVASGEWLRLWAVRHIGVISRTRSDRLGPLVASGPFARVRNPHPDLAVS